MIPTKLKTTIILAIVTILFPTLGFSAEDRHEEALTFASVLTQSITVKDILKIAEKEAIPCQGNSQLSFVPFDGTALENIRFAKEAAIDNNIERTHTYYPASKPAELAQQFPNLVIYQVHLGSIQEIWLKVEKTY